VAIGLADAPVLGLAPVLALAILPPVALDGPLPLDVVLVAVGADGRAGLVAAVAAPVGRGQDGEEEGQGQDGHNDREELSHDRVSCLSIFLLGTFPATFASAGRFSMVGSERFISRVSPLVTERASFEEACSDLVLSKFRSKESAEAPTRESGLGVTGANPPMICDLSS
jgi:hypothetical protein